jgi:pyruvate/2-oxoglutarate/acetoin dehydrogenase E1 component
MKTIQFREAIQEAMSEIETRETVYLMGEEVAEYNGELRLLKECWMNSVLSE